MTAPRGCTEGHLPGQYDAIAQCLATGAYVRLEADAWASIPDPRQTLMHEVGQRLPGRLVRVKIVGKWIWVHNRGPMGQGEELSPGVAAALDAMLFGG